MKIAGSFTHIHGPDYRWEQVKEKDCVPESAGLMQLKCMDQMKRGEQLAVDMRRSRKKSVISSKRGLFCNHTPRERSVSPMFGRLQFKGVPAADNYETPTRRIL